MSGKNKCQSVTVFNETKAAKPPDPAQEVCVSWGLGGWRRRDKMREDETHLGA